MYSGERSAMETFFESCGFPTPANWNPADFYVTAVNDEFKNHCLSVDEWSKLFIAYSDKKKDEQSPTPAVKRPDLRFSVTDRSIRRSKSIAVSLELVHRYFLNIWFNPGILATRVAMCLISLLEWLFWQVCMVSSCSSWVSCSFHPTFPRVPGGCTM